MSLLFDLAGLRTRLECFPPEFATGVLARFRPFATPAERDAPVDFLAEVTLAEAQAAPSDADLQVHLSGPECDFRTAAASGALSLASRRAELTLHSSSPTVQVEYFLRILYALLAEAHGGLMLHCAGVLTPKGAHLFVGHSGSGKSTAASFSRHRGVILNDDLIVLMPDGRRWIAHGTPFWNCETTDRNGQIGSGAVIGIYKLVKDRDVFLESMPPAVAVAELFSNCPIVNGDPARTPELLARCRQIVRATPMQRLHLRKDPAFWEALETHEEQRTKDGW
jgi:hypothetical protein